MMKGMPPKGLISRNSGVLASPLKISSTFYSYLMLPMASKAKIALEG